MLRSRLAFLKHILFALVVLALLPCVIEVAMRIDDWRHSPSSTTPTPDGLKQAECPVMHHALTPLQRSTVKNPDTGADVLVQTNSFGLRGPEIEMPKPTGVFRILCLGDERTLAPGVEESATFCCRLKELLQSRSRLKIEVVNAGIPDFCPLLGYLQLRHSLLALQPDLVIYHFDMSDISDDHRHRRHTRMSSEGIPLACANPSLGATRQSMVQRLEDRFLIVKWGKQQIVRIPAQENESGNRLDIDAPHGRYEWLRDNPPDLTIYIEQALSPLNQLAQLTSGSFARFVIAVCPAPWQASANATAGDTVRAKFGIPDNTRFESRQPFEVVERFAEQHGLALCNTYDPILQSKQPEELYLRNSPEFSPRGHELYARRLAQYIITKVPGLWIDSSRPSQLQPVSGTKPAIRR